MPVDLVQTEDGSLSCLDSETGELYHNRAGAFTEALRNFVEPADAPGILRSRQEIRVLDVCFGLGYNTWVLLSQLPSIQLDGRRILVVALERDAEILSAIPQVLKDSRLASVRSAVAGELTIGNTSIRLVRTPGLEIDLDIRQVDLRQAVPDLKEDFDLVFHDPFSPRRVPELWSVDLFKQYYRLLRSRQGKVLTYSSAAAVRAGLIEAGFSLWRTAPVGGKSGGTLATVSSADLSCDYLCPLDHLESARIFSPSGVPYRDRTLADSRKDILKRRELEQKSRPFPHVCGATLS